MSSELIPSEQPTGVCDPSTGLECRVFRIEDHFGNIRQSVGDPDRVTRAVVRGFERRGVSYVITESSEAVENVWGTSAQEPVTLTPIPATQTRSFKDSSLDFALQALQAGPSRIIVRSPDPDQEASSPEVVPLPLPTIVGTQALQSTLLTRDHFLDEDISVRFAGRMFKSLRSIGMWTFADLLAMGMSQMKLHAQGATSGLRDRSWHYINAAVMRHTGLELGDERAPLTQLPQYYDDIAHATPAIVLPQGNFPFYKSLALVVRPTLRLTVGNLAEAYQIGSLDAVSYNKDPAHLKQLEGFVWRIVIKGLIEPFNTLSK